MKTKVVNKYSHIPTPNDIYIGRGSMWGNRFTHLNNSKFSHVVKVDTRAESVRKYEEELLQDLPRLQNIHKLRGKTLVCFCKPKLCHGDVLAKYADMPRKELEKLIEGAK